MRRLWLFCKVLRNKFPRYRCDKIPACILFYSLRHYLNVSSVIFSQRSLRNGISLAFEIYQSIEKQILARLCLEFSHHNQHKLKHNLKERNHIFSCIAVVQSTNLYFLFCHLLSKGRKTLLNKINKIDIKLFANNHARLVPINFKVMTNVPLKINSLL